MDARNFEVVLDLDAASEREDTAFDADAFGQKVRSVGDFLAQKDEVSIRMETSDFAVEQLQQFLPPDFAELPEAGKIDGVVTVVGTFGKPEVQSKITVRGLSRTR